MNDAEPPLSLSTRCVHGGWRPTPEHPGVVPPVDRSSTFLQHAGTHPVTDAGDWDRVPVYARYAHPTGEAAERRLAAIEGCEGALLFGSGLAALHAALLALLGPVEPGEGAPIAVARELYGGTSDLLAGLAQLGVGARTFGVEDRSELAVALDAGARVVLCESLSNPTGVVADLPRLADAAHAAGARLLVDATFVTPALQRPLELGADLVVHSATKYLAGHSDVVAGAVCGARADLAPVWTWRKRAGGVLDPGAAALVDRGLRTLDLRMRAHCRGARHLARRLAAHPAVRRVHHASLPTHPTHDRARRLLRGAGGVLAFELRAGDAALRPFVARLELAVDAPSLGGVETLVSLPRHMSHAALDDAGRRAAGIEPGLVRLAVGIEDPADLWRDLEQALDAL